MAEQEYRKAAQRSIRKRVGTCSCPAKEDKAVHKSISTPNLFDPASVLTEPFDNSVAHAICSLCRLSQHSFLSYSALAGYG